MLGKLAHLCIADPRLAHFRVRAQEPLKVKLSLLKLLLARKSHRLGKHERLAPFVFDLVSQHCASLPAARKRRQASSPLRRKVPSKWHCLRCMRKLKSAEQLGSAEDGEVCPGTRHTTHVVTKRVASSNTLVWRLQAANGAYPATKLRVTHFARAEHTW